MLKHLDLFSGIGGFALAAKIVGGIETKQFVEIDAYCQKVLAKNFPGVPIHDDISTFAPRFGEFDIITGGFPCQDISSANPNGRGLEGERSGLFFELIRIVRIVRPNYLVLENVPAMLTKQKGRVMGTVLKELSESGFNAEWQTISAASMGAPHLRERVFVVAYRDCKRRDSGECNRGERQIYCYKIGNLSETPSDGQQLFGVTRKVSKASTDSNTPQSTLVRQENWQTLTKGFRSGSWWGTEPGVLRVANGIPNRVERIRGLGNAIVPQCGAIALQRVLDIHNSN